MEHSGWQTVQLGELVTLQRGYDLPDSQRRPGTIPVMGSAGITGYHDTARTKGPGVTIGRSGVGSMGVVSYSPVDYWPHNTTLFVTDFRGNDERFIYYFLGHLNLRRFDSGSAQASLNRNYIYPIPVQVPPIGEQRAIAHVLGALDDKIELNRRMNETLEAMACALFKSWFVDFDPVRAKAKGRKPTGLDAGTLALFPRSFVDSPLGPIPQGWRVTPLGELAEAVKGLSYKGSGLSGTGLPLHNLNSVYEGGGYKYEGIKYYQGEYRERHVLHPGDVIVANTEQGHDLLLIGCPAIVPKRFGAMGLFSHHLYRVRPLQGSPLTPHFIYLLLMTQRFRDEVTGHTNGTTVNMLPVDGLERPLLVVPPAEVVARFEQVVDPLFRKAEQIHDELPALAAVRGALLPKLLSGEIRVKEAERLVERRT